MIGHLRSARRGTFGAFILSRESPAPSLWIQFNGEVAYVHYFPDGVESHPGFQPTGMTPQNCKGSVRFLQTAGSEADGFEAPASTLVAAEDAYIAATQFFERPGLPSHIRWLEL
jgi:hypothetical protein